MKRNKQKFIERYVLILFISGILLAIIGKLVSDNDFLFYIGIGLISSSMAISIVEVFKRK